MKKETKEKKYRISEVAELLGVHEDTLRNWEREGFVVPERIGKRKDRRYTAEMIGEIRKKGLVSDLAKKGQKSKKNFSEYTKDELIKELQLLKKQKKYGLVWEDHKENVVEKCRTEAPILVSKKEKRIKDKDLNKATNILIEGDNYHALQVLNYTHKGKIDVIYIDPPYNTGNKDFIYNDSYVDKEDNFRHSKWISFMEARLRLAKQLLKKNGVIFMSIDDNEQAQLKILCDGVFGQDNFLANIIWQKKYTQSNDAKFFSATHDFILCYAKNVESAKIRLLPRTEKQNERYKNLDNDPRGVWMSQPIQVKTPSQAYIYEIITPVGKKFLPPKGRSWQFSKEKYEELVNDNQIWFGKDGSNVPRIKKFLLDTKDGVIPKTMWMYDEVGSNDDGKRLLKEILPNESFDSPKPISLIKHIINLSITESGTVLDFMAGSGTTGHAVLDLNKEYGGNRKFILCTNNELNGFERDLRKKGLSEEEIQEHGICRRITHQRIQKSIEGYTTSNGKKVKGLGGSLEYFKTEFVDVENIDKVSDKKKLEFTYEAGQMIALKEDSFREVEKNKNYQIFTNGKDKYVGIYFRENLGKLSEMEKKILDKKDVKLYIFSHSENDFKNDYAEYKNVRVENIPEPILKIYKSLNN